jgi:hypothetical protein
MTQILPALHGTLSSIEVFSVNHQWALSFTSRHGLHLHTPFFQDLVLVSFLCFEKSGILWERYAVCLLVHPYRCLATAVCLLVHPYRCLETAVCLLVHPYRCLATAVSAGASLPLLGNSCLSLWIHFHFFRFLSCPCRVNEGWRLRLPKNSCNNMVSWVPTVRVGWPPLYMFLSCIQSSFLQARILNTFLFPTDSYSVLISFPYRSIHCIYFFLIGACLFVDSNLVYTSLSYRFISCTYFSFLLVRILNISLLTHSYIKQSSFTDLQQYTTGTNLFQDNTDKQHRSLMHMESRTTNCTFILLNKL